MVEEELEWTPGAMSALLFSMPLLNYTTKQDLRPQDSIQFLRRVSTDFQKSDALHFLSQIDASLVHSSFEDLPRPEMIAGTPPPPLSAQRVLHDHAPPDHMSPNDHSFVKTTFSKCECSTYFIIQSS